MSGTSTSLFHLVNLRNSIKGDVTQASWEVLLFLLLFLETRPHCPGSGLISRDLPHITTSALGVFFHWTRMNPERNWNPEKRKPDWNNFFGELLPVISGVAGLDKIISDLIGKHFCSDGSLLVLLARERQNKSLPSNSNARGSCGRSCGTPLNGYSMSTIWHDQKKV